MLINYGKHMMVMEAKGREENKGKINRKNQDLNQKEEQENKNSYYKLLNVI
jgi:hypothetical protein